jgi:valyl-tRNA synthetase
VRNIRAELGIAPTTPLSIRIPAEAAARLEPLRAAIANIGRIDAIEPLPAGERPAGEPSAAVDGIGELFVPLRGAVDAADVRTRLERDLARVDKELDGVTAKLSKPTFVERAPADIVEKEREKAAHLQERQSILRRHIEALSQ